MATKALVVAASALAAITTAAPDVTVLAVRATNLVHSQRQFRKAVLLEAEGTPAAVNPTVRTARGIVRWRFVFDNQGTGGKYASVTVLAVRGHLGKVRGHTEPFLEDQVIRTVPKMTLARAIERLHHAGYSRFSAVTLRKRLYPGVKHPEYIFTVGSGRYEAVDTTTGRVKRLA